MKSKIILRPSKITIIPAAQLIYFDIPPIREKVVETRMPKTIKTEVKPRTNPTEARMRRDCVLSRPTPPRMLKYEGINGRTHGDKNESIPAANTNNNEKSVTIYTILFYNYRMSIVNKNNIKALAMDLDGTLLAPGGILSERTIAAIRKCREKGLKIIIATGRVIKAAEKYILPLEVSGPVVYFNGALVANMPEGKIISFTKLDIKAAELLIDFAREKGLYLTMYFPDRINPDGSPSKEIHLAAELDLPGREIYYKHTGILAELKDLKKELSLRGGCLKALFMEEPDILASVRVFIQKQLGDRVYATKTMRNALEIMNAGVSKGRGLEIVMDYLSLKREEVIAFGDEENDIPMSSAAGFFVAPLNAKDEVKAKANLVVGSNEEDGVAAFLEDFFEL